MYIISLSRCKLSFALLTFTGSINGWMKPQMIWPFGGLFRKLQEPLWNKAVNWGAISCAAHSLSQCFDPGQMLPKMWPPGQYTVFTPISKFAKDTRTFDLVRNWDSVCYLVSNRFLETSFVPPPFFLFARTVWSIPSRHVYFQKSPIHFSRGNGASSFGLIR